jgi:hypothetical protein
LTAISLKPTRSVPSSHPPRNELVGETQRSQNEIIPEEHDIGDLASGTEQPDD